MLHKSIFVGLLFTFLFSPILPQVSAWNYGGFGTSPTFTPTPTISLTPTAAPMYLSACDSLVVVSGNNSTIPATVNFRVKGSDNRGSIGGYRIFYGDGTFDETTSSEVTHGYQVSGTFLARAEIKDSQGNWKGGSACEVPVTVQSTAIETQKSDCSDLFITDGNYTQAPVTARYTVTGYDNKGSLKRYKIDYGDGTSEEKTDNHFEKRYNTAGTYTIRAYIMDTKDTWKGGGGSCSKSLYINTYPLTKQPTTGTPTWFTLLALTGGFWSMSYFAFKKLQTVS